MTKKVKFDPNGGYPSIEKNPVRGYDIKQDGRVYGNRDTENAANDRARELFPD